MTTYEIKKLKNHIGLSFIAAGLTNIFFVIWFLLDKESINNKVADSITFWQLLIITNVGLVFTSLVALTYKKLLVYLVKMRLPNVLRLIINIGASVVTFFISSFGLFIVHFVVSQYYGFSEAIQSAVTVISSTIFGSLIAFFAFISALMFFISNLERRSGNLSKLISQSFGDSVKPILVKRGFMFIDLNDSTRLAEELGSIQYAFLLRNCFRILNELVGRSSFDIYQYVGDEAVITWDANSPKVDQKAIELFIDYKSHLEENAEYFEKSFETIPKFKCAIHTGEVVKSEIGGDVKHLVYHGDVLNAASRLLGHCRSLKTDCIITKVSILDKEALDGKYDLQFETANNLKGKTEQIECYTIKRKERFNEQLAVS
ncbi:MAG: adenylate/guanylate cyclase domain-containing protein [Bacteroidota bacterium]